MDPDGGRARGRGGRGRAHGRGRHMPPPPPPPATPVPLLLGQGFPAPLPQISGTGASTSSTSAGTSTGDASTTLPDTRHRVDIIYRSFVPQNYVSRVATRIMFTDLELGAAVFDDISPERVQSYWRAFQIRWDPEHDSEAWYAFLGRAKTRYNARMTTWHKAYAIKDYWARPEVIAKREQCQANRNSQPWGEGGVARHRAGSKTQLERAMEFVTPVRKEVAERLRAGDDYSCTPRPWRYLHVPEDGENPHNCNIYLISKFVSQTEVQQEVEQLSQQHASSAGENTDPEETSPTQEVDMSQLYINKAGKSKGQIVGLGNYAKTRKVLPSGPGSTSSGISYLDVNHRVAQMEAQMQ
ncbi:hypothetical protein ACS0TY_006027 [Phlomoides rotata]